MTRPKYIHERMGGQCREEDVARYVLVPGSEKRVERFASLWDESRQVAHHYEFLVYSGRKKGIPITACSTGIGGRSVSIAVDEMANLGGDTFLRVGVTGGIQPGINVGDLIISTAAVRMDRTSEHYVFIDYPALAHFEVTSALIAAAEELGHTYHAGIGATASSFYAGEGVSSFNGYRHSGMDHIESDLRAAGVLDWDTETATLFTLCSLYGLRAGRINAVVDDPQTGEYNAVGEVKAIETGLRAIEILAGWDRQKEKEGRMYWVPTVAELEGER